MAPAFGASSLGFAASAFRYARCKARTLVAYGKAGRLALLLGDALVR